MREVFALVGKISIQGVEAVYRGLDGLDKKLTTMVKPIDKFGKSLEYVGRKLTILSAPLIGAGVAAVKFGADFEKSMVTSIAIMGDVSDAMRKDMEQTARDVAKTTTVSANDAAKAYYFLASAGLTAAQSIKALPRVAKFAEAGQFDLERATELLTDAQSALGLRSKDAAENLLNLTRVSDVLVDAANLSNASVQQFSEALTDKAAAALRVLNKDMEEGVAVLAVFADQGLKGAAGGEALHIVMRDLQTQAIKNSKAFKNAGIAVYDGNEKMRNMADIIEDLEKRLSGMSDQQKRAELMTLGFQDRSVAHTMTLIGMSNAIRDYEVKLRQAAGTTDEVANKQMQNFWDQLQMLKSKMVDVALTIYKTLTPIIQNELMPAVDKIAAKIQGLAKWFSELSPGMREFIVKAAAFIAISGPLLIALGKLVGTMKLLVDTIIAAKIAVMKFNIAAIANPIGIAIVAVAGLTLALSGLADALTTVESKQKGFSHQLNDMEEKLTKAKARLAEYDVKRTGVAKYWFEQTHGERKELEKYIADLEKQISSYRKAKGELEKTVDEKVSPAAPTKTGEPGKPTGGSSKYFTEEEIAAAKSLAQKRKDFESEWTETLLKETGTRLEIMEYEKQQALQKARELKEGTETVERVFAVRRQKIMQEMADALYATEDEIGQYLAQIQERRANEEKARIEYHAQWVKRTKKEQAEYELEQELKKARAIGASEEELARIREYFAEKEKKSAQDTAIEWLNKAQEITSQTMGIFSALYENKAIAIDNDYQRQKEAIENSTRSEKDKKAALETLDAETEKKRKALRRKQAVSEKLEALFSIALNTAVSVTKVLWNPILAAIVGGIGLAQAAMVAARPIPLAEGGIAKKRSGGVLAQIAEGNEDEGIIPMRTGIPRIARAISQFLAPALNPIAMPGLAMAGAPGGAAHGAMERRTETHLHIGTLIGDERGIKDLFRRLDKYSSEENNRKGI